MGLEREDGLLVRLTASGDTTERLPTDDDPENCIESLEDGGLPSRVFYWGA